MKVFRDPAHVGPGDGGRVVTIGVFDGVHLGHQAVLRLVAEIARARDLTATVLTFDRHPAEVVRPAEAPCALTGLEHKLELLAATDWVDECLVVTFDVERSREHAEAFVEEVLARALDARVVVVGSDFRFGYRRRGSVTLLQQMGADLGFEVIGLGLVASPDGREATDGGVPYTSTLARACLASGDVDGAAAVLGRPHEVRGTVTQAADEAVLAVDARLCVPAPGLYSGALDETGHDPRTVRVHVVDPRGAPPAGRHGSPGALRFTGGSTVASATAPSVRVVRALS